MSRERTLATLVAVAGALVAGVMAWRLAGSTYRVDVETLCNAESRSGWTLRQDMPALTEWLRGHLATAEGHVLFARLGDVEMASRAARLGAEAAKLGIASCPLTRSYDALVAEGDYRTDLERLCSTVTFPALADLDDVSRLEALEDWIEHDASNPQTKALAAPLRAAVGPRERARVLRAASTAIDIFTCDIAKTLENPPASLDGGDVNADSGRD